MAGSEQADLALDARPEAPPAPLRGPLGAPLVEAAEALARQLLGAEPERLAHSAAVARRAEQLAQSVAPEHRAPLVSAAWLHDIGYSLAVEQTGFHPVDGARHLRRLGWPAPIQDLVAHHSGSRFVAAVRRLEAGLAEFDFREDELSDALTAADQTTGPGGRAMTVEERMAEMLARHGADSPNGLAHVHRQPYLVASVRRVARRLQDLGQSPRRHRLLEEPY